ncbi:MAG: YfhO family protein [Clostridium sp.]|nr:YfhO family protein [Clostridium sp.]MCM1444596.1 YfhO family protein [Candidatus Amulumruptor caecigallinarius]
MKKIFNYFLVFLIPIAIMVLLYACVGIFPFGSKTILTVDLQDQYVEFFAAFKNIIQNGGNIFYSFSKTLGGNMFGLITYYLLSPLNFITLFFSLEDLPNAIFLINILKIGIAGITSYVYFKNTFKDKNKLNIIFSICYALTAYNIVYSQNIMWLDGVIWLPIVFLGIDKLIYKKPILFYISMVITIFSNYYIGYMTCIASLIYFIYKMYLKNNYKFSIKNNKKELIYFFKYILLAVGTTAVILLPSIFSLMSGKVDGDLTELIPNQTYALLDLVNRFYLGSFKNTDLSGGMPNVYISMIVIFLVFMYFFNKKIDIKEKKASLILISIFIFSFLLYPLDIIWHLFQHPVGFAYRYSFIFDFILLIIAYKSYLCFDEINKKKLTKFLGIALLVTLIVDKVTYTEYSYYKIIGTFTLLLVYAIYFYKKDKKNINIFICLLVVVEMFLNSLLIVVNIKYAPKKEYINFIDSYGSAVNSIKSNDNTFYRIEKDKFYSTNDPMLLNYYGISHFSSTYEGINNKLLGDYLGIFNRFYITNYLGSTLVTNSLFNIKYLMLEKNVSYYNLIDTYDNINIYQNNYYLPFMFMVDNSILDLDLQKLDAFNNQNKIINYMTNTNENVFLSNSYNVTLNNLKLDEEVTKYKQYKKVSSAKPSSIEFNIDINHDGILYAYISSDSNKKVEITLNGEMLIDSSNQNEYRYNILELGYYKKGDTVNLEFTLLEDTLKINDYMFYTLDEELFKEKIDILNSNDFLQIDEFKQNYIKGIINVTDSNKLLYTSIPVDKGWHIYIDGAEVKYETILNTFIGLKLDSGEHIIEFEYIPRGFDTGLMVSMLSICLFLYFLYHDNKKNKKLK